MAYARDPTYQTLSKLSQTNGFRTHFWTLCLVACSSPAHQNPSPQPNRTYHLANRLRQEFSPLLPHSSSSLGIPTLDKYTNRNTVIIHRTHPPEKTFNLYALSETFSEILPSRLSNGADDQSHGHSERRDRTKVIHDILQLTTRKVSKTAIVHSANLNFRLADQYIGLLLARGLLDKSTSKRGFVHYLATDRGIYVLSLLTKLESALFGIDSPNYPNTREPLLQV